MAALPGGWIADRLIGAQRAVMAGGALMTIGNLMLAIPGPPALFFAGLTVIILGVGLLKPNISTLVAELYPDSGARRDAGFTIFYMGINLGAFIGPLIAGWLALRYGWRVGFLAAAVGMPLGLLQFWLSRGRLGGAGDMPTARTGRRSRARLGGARHCDGGTRRGGRVAAQRHDCRQSCTTGQECRVRAGRHGGRVLSLPVLRRRARPDERRRVQVVLVMFVACALFWSGFEQAGSSMNLFAKRHTDRFIGGFEIPAGWFQSVQPAFVILFAPVSRRSGSDWRGVISIRGPVQVRDRTGC